MTRKQQGATMGDEGGDRDMVEEQFNIWAVFKTIGSQFLQIDAIMPVIEKFVKGAGHSGFGNSDMKSAQFRSDCENALFFHPRLKESFHATMNDFTSFAMANGYALGAILMSNREKCRECKKKLYLDGKPKVVVIYHANFGTRLGSRYTKKCTGCHISEHYGYWTKHDKKHIDLDSGQKEYIMSTEETAIDVKLLEQYASLLIVGALPFTTFVNAYNRMYSTDISQAIDSFTSSPSKRRKRDSPADLTDLIQKRRRLDRRRFEDAFFLYASIRVRTKYSIPMEYTPYDTNEMLKMLCVSYYDAFVKKWGDHCCDTPGCEEIIVLDGNMKNARQVCCCNKIGYVQFSGLQEKVVTGCPNTPMQRHRYCSTHLGFAMPFRNDDVVPSALNQEQDNPLILSIISQKTTRQGRLLELLWSDNRKSWVRENNLPEEIKKLLEHNENLEHVTVSVTEIGQTRTEFRRKTKDEVTSSLNLSSNDIVDAKRLKYFIGQEDAHDLKDELYALKCGTEKGKHTAKHTKTAGILVFEKPCGIVIDFQELFGSESKTQVYGHLHTLLQREAHKKTEVICYDDACHLKKFAINPRRSGFKETTQKMSRMSYIIDRFHFKNHVDPWCISQCNPRNCHQLEGVNTEVCEQLFAWLSKFCHMTKYMGRWSFIFLMLYVIDHHNEDVEMAKKR